MVLLYLDDKIRFPFQASLIPVWQTVPAFKDTPGSPVYEGFALKTLLDYWRVV